VEAAVRSHASNPVVYFVIFGALIALTVLTVAVAQADIGGWHTPVGLLIAVAKATLVVLFFMHALGGERLTWAIVFAAVATLLLLVVGVLSDVWTRWWLAA
jgi:cytochrome c oxidase subunit 4